MATYYVDSVAGLDANDGLSEVQAWKTLAKLPNASAQPGDSFLLKAGSNWAEDFEMNSSGTSEAPITIGVYGSGAKPILHRFAAFYESWFNISGVQLTAINTSAFRLGACSNITVADCNFDGNFANWHTMTAGGYNASSWCEDILIRDCFVFDAGDGLHGTPWEVGISIETYSRRVTVLRCTGENCTDNNFGTTGDNVLPDLVQEVHFLECVSLGSRMAHGFELGFNVADCSVKRCLVKGIHERGIASAEAIRPVYESNVVWCEKDDGLGISVSADGAVVQNNLIIGTVGTKVVKGIWLTATCTNTTVKNNIVAFNNSSKYFPQLLNSNEDTSEAVIDNNLYYNGGLEIALGQQVSGAAEYSFSLTDWQASYPQYDQNSIEADPQLAGYRLAPSSPCIGAGDSSVLPLDDYYGDAFTSPINMGAVEAALALSNPTQEPTGDGATLTIDSNSAAGALYSYSKATAFTGSEAEIAAEIIANGISQEPVVGTNTRTVTGQDSLTPHYAGWVQDSEAV